ncbi:MAG: M48 family metallopeptidase [Microcoleus sp. SIO2G3]|nr:M48 family metallopeptidase [Microcoleus sp. SIO2G3]
MRCITEATCQETDDLRSLVHLLVPNHGKVFKSFMYAYLPDWEEREQQLQSNYGKIINTSG